MENSESIEQKSPTSPDINTSTSVVHPSGKLSKSFSPSPTTYGNSSSRINSPLPIESPSQFLSPDRGASSTPSLLSPTHFLDLKFSRASSTGSLASAACMPPPFNPTLSPTTSTLTTVLPIMEGRWGELSRHPTPPAAEGVDLKGRPSPLATPLGQLPIEDPPLPASPTRVVAPPGLPRAYTEQFYQTGSIMQHEEAHAVHQKPHVVHAVASPALPTFSHRSQMTQLVFYDSEAPPRNVTPAGK